MVLAPQPMMVLPLPRVNVSAGVKCLSLFNLLARVKDLALVACLSIICSVRHRKNGNDAS